jgi:hypothetical protein
MTTKAMTAPAAVQKGEVERVMRWHDELATSPDKRIADICRRLLYLEQLAERMTGALDKIQREAHVLSRADICEIARSLIASLGEGQRPGAAKDEVL